jgi:hypothetical protein
VNAGSVVPELGHHVRRVLAADEEDRGEGVPQLVRRHALGQGLLLALHQQRLGVRDDGPDHALPGVVLVAAAAARGREDEIGWLRFGGGVPVARQLVAQRWQDPD